MRLDAVEHALQTLQRVQADYKTANCIDVGGTKQVWLVVPRRHPAPCQGEVAEAWVACPAWAWEAWACPA